MTSQTNIKSRQLITVDPGLEGVIVGSTRISDVDGAAGTLSYRGNSVATLTNRPFAEVASWVALGKSVPTLIEHLNTQATLSERERALVLSLPRTMLPMQVLQGIIPLLDKDIDGLPLTDADLDQVAPGERLPAGLVAEAALALVIAGKLPEVIATHFKGSAVHTETSGYCNRFCDMIGVDSAAEKELVQAFEVMQILQLEHSFNASTFAARVIASTLAPIENALSGAVGTLHGVLHGGADQAALETADAVADPAKAAAFVDQCLTDGTRVMGMGHREYKVLDPRARFAKELAERVSAGTRHERTFAVLAAIEARFSERMQAEGKSLYANIEFYKGLIFRMLGLPPAYFTALFAMARVFGYTAHVLESRINNRLIRPAATYCGV